MTPKCSPRWLVDACRRPREESSASCPEVETEMLGTLSAKLGNLLARLRIGREKEKPPASPAPKPAGPADIAGAAAEIAYGLGALRVCAETGAELPTLGGGEGGEPRQLRRGDLTRLQDCMAKLSRWAAGGLDEKTTPALEDDCVASLWGALSALRDSGRYAEAVQVWALIRRTTPTACAELVELARSMARAYSDGPAPALEGRNLRFAVLAGAEALQIPNAPSLDEIRGLFDALRIDWSQPTFHAIRSHIEAIAALEALAEDLPETLVEDLAFWRAMGKWRQGDGDVTDAFTELVARINSQRDDVYRWSAMRVAWERDRNPAALEPLRVAWHLAVNDDVDRLTAYFDALTEVETKADLRKPSVASPPPIDFMDVLAELPKVLRLSDTLWDHVESVIGPRGVSRSYVAEIELG